MKNNILSRTLAALFVSVLAVVLCNYVQAGNEQFHKYEQEFKCRNYCCNHFEHVITLKRDVVTYHAVDCKTLESIDTHSIWMIIDKDLFEKDLPSHIETQKCNTCNTLRRGLYSCEAKCCDKYAVVIDRSNGEIHKLDCKKLNNTVLPARALLICKDCYDFGKLKKDERVNFCFVCFKGVIKYKKNYAFGNLM